MPCRPLPHDGAAALRALLPLPLVPARDRNRVRAQRDDRGEHVELLQGNVEVVDTPSNSGKGQKIARCPSCRIALWSNYAGAGDAIRFVRVGTLDDPDRLPPDIHIHTGSKQPWVVLPAGTPAVREYYKASEMWPEESLARRAALLARNRATSGKG